jgi:DNA-binding transcriptional MerR regulator
VSRTTPTNGPAAPRRKDGFLTTGDMARLSSNTLRTVRFYEEAGLLSPVQRTDGGHRLFPQSELRKLQLVSDLRAAGFSLEEIREMIESKRRGQNAPDTARGIVTRLEAQIGSMRSRLSLLTRLLAELEGARQIISHCAECPDPANFPEGCAGCDRLKDADGKIPSAVSVLWDVDGH